MLIIKATGQKEEFSRKKLLESIKRAGIPADMQEEVLSHVQSKIYENIPTSEIYHHITEFLGKSRLPYTKARYNLKQAIMDFGPTGYPFEDFAARIFMAEGYDNVHTRVILKGKCITHEVDVVAERNQERIIVEAKFHNRTGVHTQSHVPMYTKARFDDIKARDGFNEVWLITNTRATSDAIAYAECESMKVITWSYPDGRGLRDLVEKYQLHPITTLTTLSKFEKQELLRQGVVLCSDLCKKQPAFDALSIPEERKFHILKEAAFSCNLHNG